MKYKTLCSKSHSTKVAAGKNGIKKIQAVAYNGNRTLCIFSLDGVSIRAYYSCSCVYEEIPWPLTLPPSGAGHILPGLSTPASIPVLLAPSSTAASRRSPRSARCRAAITEPFAPAAGRISFFHFHIPSCAHILVRYMAVAGGTTI
jgi:hypothetical protein